MQLLSMILVVLVGLEAFFIMGLEMFGSQTAFAAQAFGVPLATLKDPQVKTLMGNQGLYNGFIGVLIFFAQFWLAGTASVQTVYLALAMVIVAAIYGGITATRQILWVQGLPALLAIIAFYFAH
ncbi:DUF1304 domain-containing protein [Lacticaseibacillus brantae]|uniref:Integral membrane protein n=1 Tax=Lacticaseibacillus brantae DSM 23927 TaxID=1423727 RepID=A0A0R2B1S1_9LACO|nr:DUF1304 domain-containing protein [Lacticaseibacillus brantae]KRM72981.1 hypothetical protein FC34_GL000696 [Lacticaseibacillus brantae DSM 23927]